MPPLAALQAAQVAENGSSSSALSQCGWGGRRNWERGPGWAGRELGTPQRPGQPGSISTESAGEFCSFRASLVPPHQALKGADGGW